VGARGEARASKNPGRVYARSSTGDAGGVRVLLIGNDELTGVTHRALRGAGAIVSNLRDPSDLAIRTALAHLVDTVVVISKDDHISLRNALVVEASAPAGRSS
jgi:hypothetical protein